MQIGLSKHTENHHHQIGWSLLVLLLLLRIPFAIAIIYFLPIENQNGAAFYQVGTYLLICFLIWWERGRFGEFHLDAAALFLIILLRPVYTLILSYWDVDSPLAFPRPMGLALWAISLGLIVALLRRGIKPGRVTARSMIWLILGLLLGCGLSILENFQTFHSMLLNGSSQGGMLTPILYSTSLNLLYHVGFAPLNEEPLFRGFLWGYLRQLQWKESWILFIQAILFTSAHIYYASQFPLRFWILIPLAGILFGLLTWCSRSITPAILAHGLVNGSVYLLIVLIFKLLAG